MTSTFAPELSFIPAAYPHEIIAPKPGKAAHEAFKARYLKPIKQWLRAVRGEKWLDIKLDPLHREFQEDQTYSVEITPIDPWSTEALEDQDALNLMTGALQLVFDGLKDRFGLVPQVVTRERGVDTHWPGGGLHVHYGAAIMGSPYDWYDHMKLFHTNLVTDFANRPYLRWLFAQWFADQAGRCIVDEQRLKDTTEVITPEQVLDWSLNSSCITPRWMYGHGRYKQPFFTFEFRNFFGMPKDAAQVMLCARFVHAWMGSIYRRTVTGQAVPFELTLAKLRDMKDLRKAWRICANALDSLHLPVSAFRSMYDLNYVNRVRHGRLV